MHPAERLRGAAISVPPVPSIMHTFCCACAYVPLCFFHLRIGSYTTWKRVSYVMAARIQSSFTFQLNKVNLTFNAN